MSFDQADFNPLKAPEKADVVSRGVRLGTAATVMASFFAAAPTTGMMDNFFNPELLDVWPLRDEVSLSGVKQLLAGHDHQGPLRSDWLGLYTATMRSLVPPRPNAVRIPPYSRTLGRAHTPRPNFSNIQMANVSADHLGAELAFSGHLATMAAMAHRDSTNLVELGTQTSGLRK